jgi:hypothetical protein
MNYYTDDGCSYEGMDQDTVTRIRAELIPARMTTYITKDEYDALVAQQVKP